MSWIKAVKEWNATKNTGKYKIPKKGSKEYNEVKKIQMKLSKVVGAPKKEFDDNVKLYKRTKKNIKEANETFEATKPLQKQTINNLKRANTAVDKLSIVGLGHEGGSLRKALNFANRNPADFVKLANQQQTGSGLNQVGGFLPAFIIPFIPAITTALGAFATGAAGAAGAAAVDAIIGDGMGLSTTKKQVKSVVDKVLNGKGLDKKQTALLKALEGEKKSSKPNKARDMRVMRKYKKNLKMMTGSGIENIILENPEEAFEVGKIIFGAQNAPKVKDGKVVIPPTPLENLWNMIF